MTLGLCYRVGEWMPTVHRRLNKGPEWGEVLFGTVLWGFIIAGSYALDYMSKHNPIPKPNPEPMTEKDDLTKS